MNAIQFMCGAALVAVGAGYALGWPYAALALGVALLIDCYVPYPSVAVPRAGAKDAEGRS